MPTRPDLDRFQKEAVTHVAGPILVLAGAGTGKTTVLVERVIHLIEAGHARPDEVLAITYTRNAAAELCARVTHRLPGVDLRASTFHSFCQELLVRNGRDFGVLDKTDLWIFLRQNISKLPLKRFIKAASVGEFLDDLIQFFERCHDELVTPQAYAEYVERVCRGELPLPRVGKSKEVLPADEVHARCREISAVFSKATEMLREQKLGTFGDQIAEAVRLLRSDEKLREREHQRARFILIDEFQDSNLAQIELAQLLAGSERNVFAVGDPDQAIYRFRGATSGAFDEFQRRFTGARLVHLLENRRSTPPILGCAFATIDENPAPEEWVDGVARPAPRKPLQSWRAAEAAKNGDAFDSQPVEVVLGNDETCAADIAETIERLRRGKCRIKDHHGPCAYSHFLVLYRNHKHRDKLIEELSARGIPFLVKGLDVFDTTPVRDMLAILRAAHDPGDSVSAFRVAAMSHFGIDPEELRTALAAAEDGTTLLQVLNTVHSGRAVTQSLAQLRDHINKKKPVSALLRVAVGIFQLPESEALDTFTRFVEAWQEKPFTTDKTLLAFVKYLEWFEEAGGSIALPTDNGKDTGARPDTVHLMSAHGAKGLEFEHVFVLRAISPSFPSSYKETLFEFPQALRHPHAILEGDPKAIHQQEERRLFYVAMTRARDTLTLYAPAGTGKDTTPPGFLRPMMKAKTLTTMLRGRPPRPTTVNIHAAAQPLAPAGEWVTMPPRPALQAMKLSATSIEAYQRCPLQFKIARDWELPGEVAAAMQYGNAVHTALKDFYDAIKAGRPKSADELIVCFRDVFSRTTIDDPLQKDLYLKQGIEQLTAFARARAIDPLPNVKGTEEFFEVELAGAKIVGRMDRVDVVPGGIAIVDYKTGRPKKEEDAEKSLQLSIYALAALAKGERPDRLVFINIENNTAVSAARTDEQLHQAREDVRAVAAGIAVGNFAPKVGYHCGWCAYRTLCPEQEESSSAAGARAAKA